MRNPSDAYYEGSHAARKGRSRESCPYPLLKGRLGIPYPSDLRREWMAGHRSVQLLQNQAA